MHTFFWTLKSGEAVLLHLNDSALAEFTSLNGSEQDDYVESSPRVAGTIGL